jgi:uncharacterized iron-regulated membrane protein
VAVNATVEDADALHRAVWRWHFYAGAFVAPVLLVLATSGLVMLLRAPIEAALYGDITTVTARATAPRPPSEQLAALRAHFPDSEAILFVPPRVSTDASEFAIVPATHHHDDGHGHDTPARSVFVDPHDARVLGTLDRRNTPYGWANAIHGSLLLGTIGDGIIEIAAGLAALLVGSGLFLARPRGASWRAVLLPLLSLRRRAGSRALHGAVGYWIAAPLLFFLLSGLTWTEVWGARLLQAWSTVAVERSAASRATATHGSLNRSVLDEVPWALEQAPLPASGTRLGSAGAGSTPDLDAVVAFARTAGFGAFRVHLPRGHDGVWTISASTMAGDIDAPRAERFLHLDRHTGHVLGDVGFDDYSPIAQFMASAVPFHQGDLGPWNVAFNAIVCLAVIGLVSLAPLLWWQRRPSWRKPAPPPLDALTGRRIVALFLVCALAFPLSAAAIAAVIACDQFVARIRSLRRQRG